jgi:hypothetical protein
MGGHIVHIREKRNVCKNFSRINRKKDVTGKT